MIGYQAINDAWKIKENMTNKVEPVIVHNNVHNNTCENFSHVLSCKKCLKKLKESFESIEPVKEEKQIEKFTNTNNDIVKFINDNFVIIIIFIVILFLLNNRQQPRCGHYRY